ncbi:hypothetical protein BABINDRAFT_14920 [Babjeviella inositovora NRRL Y-12698]|uniref:Major facilitator superfamily (MFS) profile domain-containing protein n=1 Tax=Babjeviella inositovora NRRL Y-12698 TaxID=984486 RepID=A0A1E3QKZ2_9ASCO|nr:uncharacterized protein BABINDRAFT_14920 [Babjeviella inositovora NRRL Y-12698]ODQ78345.1 hypothetical protein BABINDRAFT_14920 [Babjeviella inositovora NRRL Y-12698]
MLIPQSITQQLAWTSVVAYLGMFQFGFHLGELNAPQGVISCKVYIPGPLPSYENTFWGAHGFKTCIPMDDQEIALVTTMFTVGGLVGSLYSGKLSDMIGRKRTAKINAGLFVVGAFLMTVANSKEVFLVARFVNGLAAGSSIVVTPIFINEVTPYNHRGLLGALTQLAVSVGLVAVMTLGFIWTNVQQWRNVFAAAVVIAAVTFLAIFSTVESPKWLIASKDDVPKATNILNSLRSHRGSVHEEILNWRRMSRSQSTVSLPSFREQSRGNEEAIEDETSRLLTSDSNDVTSWQFITAKRYRSEFIAIAIIMTGQQLTGINALTYYGVSILREVVPDNVLTLTVALSLTSTVSFGLISPVVDRVGRKTLLLLSLSIMTIAVGGMAVALTQDGNHAVLCVVSCFLLLIGFACGLGPIPFLMISEMAQHDSVGPAQSVGSILNWCSNIVLAYTFPIVREVLSGYVFAVLAVTCVLYAFLIAWKVPETRNKMTYEEFVVLAAASAATVSAANATNSTSSSSKAGANGAVAVSGSLIGAAVAGGLALFL